MDNVKECSKCHEMEEHSRNRSRLNGLQAYCKKCEKAHRDKPEIKERKKVNNAEYHAKPENRERRKVRDAEYYAKPENKENKKARDAEYRAKPENKEERNAQVRERRKNDPVFRARECLRTLLREFLDGTSKSERTEELLRCSYEQFVEYQRAIASPEVIAALAAGEKIDGPRQPKGKHGGKSKPRTNQAPQRSSKGPSNAPGKSGTFADLFANAKKLR